MVKEVEHKKRNNNKYRPFQKVLVAISGNYRGSVFYTWEIDLYSHQNPITKLHNCLKIHNIKDEHILPYNGNENKLGKTFMPQHDEE